MTARELTTALRPAFADHAADLDRSSELFDRVFYGEQPATAADARALLDLDDRLRVARPAPAPVDQQGAAAVPR